MTEIATALIGLAGVCVTALVAWRRVNLERQKASLAMREMSLQSEALSFAIFLEDWQSVAAEMSKLIAETEIDRILILRAWNGVLTPKWTTAVYQLREVGQIPMQFIHTGLDDDYVARLSETKSGVHYFATKDAPPGLIKSIYEAEGVQASCWFHIDTKKGEGTDAAVITYCSFSTHTQGEVNGETQTRAALVADRLKGLSSLFNGQPA